MFKTLFLFILNVCCNLQVKRMKRITTNSCVYIVELIYESSVFIGLYYYYLRLMRIGNYQPEIIRELFQRYSLTFFELFSALSICGMMPLWHLARD